MLALDGIGSDAIVGLVFSEPMTGRNSHTTTLTPNLTHC